MIDMTSYASLAERNAAWNRMNQRTLDLACFDAGIPSGRFSAWNDHPHDPFRACHTRVTICPIPPIPQSFIGTAESFTVDDDSLSFRNTVSDPETLVVPEGFLGLADDIEILYLTAQIRFAHEHDDWHDFFFGLQNSRCTRLAFSGPYLGVLVYPRTLDQFRGMKMIAAMHFLDKALASRHPGATTCLSTLTCGLWKRALDWLKLADAAA